MKTKLQIILAILTVAALITNQPISVSASQSGEANGSQHAKQGKHKKKTKHKSRTLSGIKDVDEAAAREIYQHLLDTTPSDAAAGTAIVEGDRRSAVVSQSVRRLHHSISQTKWPSDARSLAHKLADRIKKSYSNSSGTFKSAVIVSAGNARLYLFTILGM